MMATFMLSMIPRAGGLRRPRSSRCSTPRRRCAAARNRVSSVRDARHRRVPWRHVPLPRRRARRCSPTSRSESRPAQTTAIIGSTGAGKTHARQARAAALRRDRRRRARRRRRRPRPRPGRCCGATLGFVPQRPYLFSGTVASQPPLRPPDATDDELWDALEIAQAAGLRAGAGRRARQPRRAGRHQLSRAASASGSRSPGRWSPARRSTCSTTRSRRSTSRTDARLRAALRPRTRGRGGARSSRSACPRSATPTRSSCSRTAQIVGRGRHDELVDTCPTYAEIVDVAADARRRHERPRPRAAATRRSRAPRRPTTDGARHRRGTTTAAAAEATAAAPRRAGTRPMPTASRAATCSVARRPDATGSRRSLGGHRPVRRGRRASSRSAASRSSCSAPRAARHASDRHHRHARPDRRVDFTRSRATELVARRSTSSRCCSGTSQAYLLDRCRPAHRCTRLRADVEDKLHRLPLALRRPASRAATCSAASPTTSTTSPRVCSRAEPDPDLAVHGGRRARDDVLDLAAAGARGPGDGADVDLV